MKKRILAVILSAALCVMMSATALAAGNSNSPSTGSSSSSSGGSSGSSSHKSSHSSSADTAATRGTANTDQVSVAIPAADGTVTTMNLTKYTEAVGTAVVTAAANGGANPGEAVSAMLTAPASDIFKATINVLGGKIKTVNVGGYKVAATAPDASGKTIASLGSVKGVTKYAFVVLTAVNADGTVEIVEGVVDPVTLHVMGVFRGTPATVTVSVILAA